jgi:CubicO group peptidase (beta-lactamase class C family)
MRRETLFDIASLTKVIATTQLMLGAHSEGVLRLDDPLRRFYPHAPRDVSAVTLRHLLSHSGGFAAWSPLYTQLGRNGTGRQRRRKAATLILRKPLVYRPGHASVYSDLGFMMLGDILETCYEQPLDVLFAQRIARPLKLDGIAYLPLESMRRVKDIAATERCEWRGRILSGEVHDANAWAMGGVAAHAGLFATAAGVWEFAHAMLEAAAGRLDWLPPSLLRESWQRQSNPAGTTRALGWDTPTPGGSSSGSFFSHSAIGHLGFTGCSLWIDLERQVSLILCTNRVHPSRQSNRIAQLRPKVHDLVMHALGVADA